MKELTWFRARFGKIEEVKIVGATAKMVKFANGRKEAMDSDWQWYRPTREEAKNVMVKQFAEELTNAEERVKNARERLSKAEMA